MKTKLVGLLSLALLTAAAPCLAAQNTRIHEDLRFGGPAISFVFQEDGPDSWVNINTNDENGSSGFCVLTGAVMDVLKISPNATRVALKYPGPTAYPDHNCVTLEPPNSVSISCRPDGKFANSNNFTDIAINGPQTEAPGRYKTTGRSWRRSIVCSVTVDGIRYDNLSGEMQIIFTTSQTP
jgi:hypothetical protein